MASLRLNGHLLDLEQGQLRDPHGRLVQLRPQALAVLLECSGRQALYSESSATPHGRYLRPIP